MTMRKKPAPASNPGRDLTPSEIASLKADAQRGHAEIKRLMAADLKRRIPQAT